MEIDCANFFNISPSPHLILHRQGFYQDILNIFFTGIKQGMIWVTWCPIMMSIVNH